MSASKSRKATASEDSLLRIFTVPEAPESTLSKIEQALSEDLEGFLNQSIVALEKPLHEVEKDFCAFQIPHEPKFVSDYTEEMMQSLIAHSVHTAAPSFIGHMTSALPYFVLPLSKMMVGLNQNLVKIETSKAFTPLERQVLGMMHHLIYAEQPAFYERWMHSADHSLGAFCSGGTVANITALWIARNRLLKADGDFAGVSTDGLMAGLRHYGWQDLAILVSERGHYSLGKAADLLGIGRKNIMAVATDENNRVDVDAMRNKAAELQQRGVRVMAIVGVAGTTETGNIDPLNQLADLAAELDCHFHVDAAWGGASLMSRKFNHLLNGIERADSVTIDAHKQMYVPMGAGMVIFRDPELARAIVHHAEYILRRGSKDLGSQTLEGSRPGMAMLVHACLQIIGRAGYEILIDNSLDKARYFASIIKQHPDFELISEPELCLLTYRYVPFKAQQALQHALDSQDWAQVTKINRVLDNLTRTIQKTQREQGKSFVSRTRLQPARYQRDTVTVLRVVLANPLTTKQILKNVLSEQLTIAADNTHLLNELDILCQ